MDSLTHLILSLAGGYLLACGLRLKLRPQTIPALGAASLLIDVDHLLPHFGIAHTLVLHNVFVVLAAAALVGYFSRKEWGVIFFVMLMGHLFFDMNSGIYGAPLFYPLAKTGFLIPDGWEVWLFNDQRYTVVSKAGISLAAYAGLIAAVILSSSRKGA